MGHQWYYLSDTVLAFVSYGSEISTLEIIKETLQKGKKLFVPKIVNTNDENSVKKEMIFYRITSMEQLQEGYRGILEPEGTTEEYKYSPEEAKKTLLLMPGVGFDPYRNRMGYGKGFYDRFMADKEELWIRSIAIGHTCQMTEEIPTNKHDIKPYQVILV